MKKKWFVKDELHIVQVVYILNQLAEKGIPPEHIQIIYSAISGAKVFYFNEEPVIFKS